MPDITEKRLAEKSGYSARTLQKWRVKGGGPPYFKRGRSVRYDEDEALAFLHAIRATSTADADRQRQAGEAAVSTQP